MANGMGNMTTIARAMLRVFTHGNPALCDPVAEVISGQMTEREAEQTYGISRSTIGDAVRRFKAAMVQACEAERLDPRTLIEGYRADAA